MMKKLIAQVVAAVLGNATTPRKLGRAKVRDVAFQYRMGSGFPGDVNRTHPVSIEPCLVDPATPPLIYGQAVLASGAGNDIRPIAGGDGAVTKIYGTLVRPYPTQQGTGGMASAFGAATPPVSGVIDVMRSGYMIVKIPAGQAVLKGGAVFVRIATAAGDKPIGGFEGAADGGNTIALDTGLYQFNGPADSLGNAEVMINV